MAREQLCLRKASQRMIDSLRMMRVPPYLNGSVLYAPTLYVLLCRAVLKLRRVACPEGRGHETRYSNLRRHNANS